MDNKKNAETLVVEIEDLKEVVGGANTAPAAGDAAQSQAAEALVGRSTGALPRMATDGKCGW